jgi:hypothetical protein
MREEYPVVAMQPIIYRASGAYCVMPSFTLQYAVIVA